MHRILKITLCFFVLLLPGPRAWAEEVPPAIDPVEVGRLLLAEDAPTRARGEALLRQRIEQGGELGPFLQKMAETQAGALRDAKSKDARKAAEPQQQQPAAGAVQRAQEAAPAEVAKVAKAPPIVELPPLPPLTPGHLAPGPKVHAVVVEVDRQALPAWLPERGDEGSPLVLRGDEARRMAEAAPTLVDARVLLDGARRLGPPLVAGERVRWRRALAPTKAGAWAIHADALSRGIEISAKVVPVEDGSAADPKAMKLVVEGRRGEVPLPMKVSKVRPAEGMDPVELDRPEWEVIRIEAEAPYDGKKPTALLLPGLLPNRILIVVLTPQ